MIRGSKSFRHGRMQILRKKSFTKDIPLPIRSNVSQQEGVPAASLREIIALKMLRHPNIVGLLDIVTQERCIYVVLEYMSTDLAQELDKMKKQSIPGLPERDVMVRNSFFLSHMCRLAKVSLS